MDSNSDNSPSLLSSLLTDIFPTILLFSYLSPPLLTLSTQLIPKIWLTTSPEQQSPILPTFLSDSPFSKRSSSRNPPQSPPLEFQSNFPPLFLGFAILIVIFRPQILYPFNFFIAKAASSLFSNVTNPYPFLELYTSITRPYLQNKDNSSYFLFVSDNP